MGLVGGRQFLIVAGTLDVAIPQPFLANADRMTE